MNNLLTDLLVAGRVNNQKINSSEHYLYDTYDSAAWGADTKHTFINIKVLFSPNTKHHDKP